MSTEKEEQIKRLSEYFELMGLKTDKDSHLWTIQESIWLKENDTIDLLKKIQSEIKRIKRQESTKWNIDETVIMDICLLLTVIGSIYPNLIALKDEIQELGQLQLNAKMIDKITFGTKTKIAKNAYLFGIKDTANVKLIINTAVAAIEEQQERVYEQLLPEYAKDKRKADAADKFLYKATFLLSEFLKKKKDILFNPAPPKLIASFYRYMGIIPALQDEMHDGIDGQRKTIDNWIKEGSKLIHTGK